MTNLEEAFDQLSVVMTTVGPVVDRIAVADMIRSKVAVPEIGEWYVKNGKVRSVIESEHTGDSDELADGVQIWVAKKLEDTV